MDRERRVEELLIKQEISDVMMRYCRGVNRLDMDLVRACFHPDAWEDHGSYRGPASVFTDGLEAGLRSFDRTFHFIGNQLVEIEGNRAAHEAYFLSVNRLMPRADGTQDDVLFGGRYLSVFESRDGGPWLIADRTVVQDWHRVEPIGEQWPAAFTFLQGVAGPDDLVFHLLDGERQRR
jgi:hypothetical protein